MNRRPRTAAVVAALCLFAGMAGAATAASADQHRPPAYPPGRINADVLKRNVEPFMKLSLEEVVALVPEASGIYFVGCPHCHGGAQESDVLQWEYGMGDTVRCRFCKMVFPNEQYPNNKETVIIAPSGAKQVYRYFLDKDGMEYHFEPRAWYEQWEWTRYNARSLAQIWYATKDNEYGDRAAAIAGRYAQLFPDYAVRYDYPNAPVRFFPADQKWPHEGVAPYRGGKWRWWGYDDIPTYLADVYDLLNSGYDWSRMDKVIGPDTRGQIEKDLIRLGYEVTTANPEMYSNKSPGMYTQMIRVGRIIGEPEMVHEAVNRFREFCEKRFFHDGWWIEGTTSYHDMTIGGLRAVAEAAEGYTDPADRAGERFTNLDLAADAPFYRKAVAVSREARLPNGRAIPINDTWGQERRGRSTAATSATTTSRLWPALGHAFLGAGEGENQFQVHLNWSGNYGHSHNDNGSIILFANGEELLSDIGYTHGRYRGWTIHSASHNTVVLDQTSLPGSVGGKPVTGRLHFYEGGKGPVRAIDVDLTPAYPESKVARRRLVHVHAAPGRDYVLDIFDIDGGKTRDWFLHGMCEEEGKLETSTALDTPVASLVPEGSAFEEPKKQADTDQKKFHPYGYMKEIGSGKVSGPWSATWRYGQTALRSHMLPPQGTVAYRFRAASVRPAGEDDNKMGDFMRGGIMQRHEGERSSFVAVHEPFNGEPWIEAVERDGDAIVVRYSIDGKQVTDRIAWPKDRLTVTSSAGWQYDGGAPRGGLVKGVERLEGKWMLALDKQPPADLRFIRLEMGGGAIEGYEIASVEGMRAVLLDDPGFDVDGQTGVIRYRTFPQEEHPGPLRYTLFE